MESGRWAKLELNLHQNGTCLLSSDVLAKAKRALRRAPSLCDSTYHDYHKFDLTVRCALLHAGVALPPSIASFALAENNSPDVGELGRQGLA